MNPKLPLNGCIYMLTVGRVLNTNMFQINLGQLLSRTTLKVRLCSHLLMLLKWTTGLHHSMHILLMGGKWKHTLLAPLPISYVGKQLTVL